MLSSQALQRQLKHYCSLHLKYHVYSMLQIVIPCIDYVEGFCFADPLENCVIAIIVPAHASSRYAIYIPIVLTKEHRSYVLQRLSFVDNDVTNVFDIVSRTRSSGVTMTVNERTSLILSTNK